MEYYQDCYGHYYRLTDEGKWEVQTFIPFSSRVTGQPSRIYYQSASDEKRRWLEMMMRSNRLRKVDARIAGEEGQQLEQTIWSRA